MKIAKLLVSGLVLAMSAVMVQAQDELQEFDTVEGWNILIDTTIDNGCLIQSEFDDGSDVRIGFDRAANTGYVWASNAAWGDIEDGAAYPISFNIDGEVYKGEGKGLYIDEAPGIDIEFDSMDFLLAIAQKNTMELSNEAGPVMTINLAGTDAALARAIECQEAQG